MAICPKCKAVINYLIQRRSGTEISRFFINRDGEIDCDEEEFDSDGYVYEFECSVCWEILFDNKDEAVEFLSNTDEVAEMVAEKIKQKE